MKTCFFVLFFSFAFLCHGFSQALVLEQEPFYVIKGEESGLSHPEGIAFTPDGRYVAIANSNANSIAFYEICGSGIPAFEIKGPETLLHYPHDLAFTPNGKYLAVANREGNTATIYRRNKKESSFDLNPIHIIKDSSFNGIGAVAYSPSEDILALGDTYSNRILLYLFSEEEYQSTPSCQLNASVVDGLSFSPDGKFLGVTSHYNHSALFFKRKLESRSLFARRPVNSIEGKDSRLKYSHSLAFHPTKDIIAISSAGGTTDVSFFQTRIKKHCSFFLSPIQTLELLMEDIRSAIEREYPEECGGKGVAFSPDGEVFGVCLPNIFGEDAVLFFKEKK